MSIFDGRTNKLIQFCTKDGFTVDSIHHMILNQKQIKSVNGRKFKMQVVNCNQTNDITNVSDQSDDESKKHE